MNFVQPQVFLIAEPSINPRGMIDYLDEVGGMPWWYRMTEDGDINSAEMLVEFGGRLCYRSWAPGLNANVTRVRQDSGDYLRNILASGHGSVLEHANFTFVLHNVSRVFTHELVRHRVGSAYSQESMRYVRLTDMPFWMPDWALEDPILVEKAVEQLNLDEEFQLWMADHFKLDDPGVPFEEKKHKTSFMRRFAPNGVATAIMATYNVRTLRHIIALRTSLPAEEEIRLVMDRVADATLSAVPLLMQDYSRNEHAEWIPEFLRV